MAAGQRQYTAIFAIGAKMLGSFGGVMRSAQVRMKALQASAQRMASGLWRFASRLGGLLTIFGGFAAGKILSTIFGDANKEAREAAQRTRQLTSALMENHKIAKGGTLEAQRQVALIYQHNKSLEEQGVLHKDILDTMAVQLAMKGGIPPKQIQESLDVMQDMLAATKGVAASEEDGAAMSVAWAKAVSGGKLLSLGKQGITVNKEFAKSFAKLKSPQARFNALMKEFGKVYKGFNAALRETPEGRIQLFHNMMKDLSQEIGNEVLPAQAEMADAWRKALPYGKPVIIGTLKAVASAATWAGKQLTDFLAVLNPPQEEQTGIKFFTAYRDQLGKFNAVTGQKDPAFDATTDAMNQWTRTGVSQLISALNELGSAFGSTRIEANSFGQIMAHMTDYILKEFSAMIRTDAKDIEGLKSLWQKLKDEGTVESITASWSKAWQAYYNTTKTIWDWMVENLTNEKIFGGLKAAAVGVGSVTPALPPVGHVPFASGGIVSGNTYAQLGERGPEAVIPLDGSSRARGLLNYANRAMGGGATHLNFAPQITINGNAGPAEQSAMDSRLRLLAKDFITQFKAAQQQERRLSYEGGYA